MIYCESCLASDPRVEREATTRSTNPDWAGYPLCDECAAEYNSRPPLESRPDDEAART